MCKRHQWAVESAERGCITCLWEPHILAGTSEAALAADAAAGRSCAAFGSLYGGSPKDRARRAKAGSDASRAARARDASSSMDAAADEMLMADAREHAAMSATLLRMGAR